MRAAKWIIFGVFLVLHGLMLVSGLSGILVTIAGVAGVIAGIMFLFNM